MRCMHAKEASASFFCGCVMDALWTRCGRIVDVLGGMQAVSFIRILSLVNKLMRVYVVRKYYHPNGSICCTAQLEVRIKTANKGS